MCPIDGKRSWIGTAAQIIMVEEDIFDCESNTSARTEPFMFMGSFLEDDGCCREIFIDCLSISVAYFVSIMSNVNYDAYGPLKYIGCREIGV